jgi:TPR repeat protein
MLNRCAIIVAGAFATAGNCSAQEEWEPYRRTGLFPEEGGRWLAPDMRKESVEQFTARLLDGARSGDARAMATLGRFFYVRGDAARAGEWLRKAAEAGHTGAQFDYGVLRSKGQGAELAEAYQWLWLATWSQEPGAEAALRQLSAKLEAWQVVIGVRWAAEYQAVREKQTAQSPR